MTDRPIYDAIANKVKELLPKSWTGYATIKTCINSDDYQKVYNELLKNGIMRETLHWEITRDNQLSPGWVSISYPIDADITETCVVNYLEVSCKHDWEQRLLFTSHYLRCKTCGKEK